MKINLKLIKNEYFLFIIIFYRNIYIYIIGQKKVNKVPPCLYVLHFISHLNKN